MRTLTPIEQKEINLQILIQASESFVKINNEYEYFCGLKVMQVLELPFEKFEQINDDNADYRFFVGNESIDLNCDFSCFNNAEKLTKALHKFRETYMIWYNNLYSFEGIITI